MKKRKIGIIVSICLLCLLSAGVVACKKPAAVAGGYDESGFGGSSNDYTEALVTDKKVTVDGNLDEACWAASKELDYTHENVRVRVKTVFGDLGFYVGFTVADPHVYGNPDRDVWKGSSVEIYVDRYDAMFKSIRTFQYRLSALNRHETLYGYATPEDNWTMTQLPIYGQTQVQGVLNSGATQGMTAEIFVRWDALGYDFTAENFIAPTQVKFMPVYNQSSGAGRDDARDFWVNNGGDIANPLHYHTFDANGYVDADAAGATIGDSAYGRAKSPGWDMTREGEGIVTSDVSGDQTVYFKNVYAENYAVTALVTFNEALPYIQGTTVALDPYPKAGLIAASENTVQAYILDYAPEKRSTGAVEGMFFQKGNPDPRDEYWKLHDSTDLSDYARSDQTVRLTTVKVGRYLLAFIGDGDTPKFGGTFAAMREVAETEGKASPGFYTLGCSATFTDYDATTDTAVITQKTEGILSILDVVQTRGGALTAEQSGYRTGEVATIEIVTYDGYMLTSVKVGDVEKLGEVENGRLSVAMTDATVTVTPTFTRATDVHTVSGAVKVTAGNGTVHDLRVRVDGGNETGKICNLYDCYDDGTFEIDLPRGNYTLTVTADGRTAGTVEVTVASSDVDLGTVGIHGGWAFDGAVVTVGSETTVRGFNQYREVTGLSADAFVIKTNLRRADGKFTTDGTWETGGIGIKAAGTVYRVYVMREGDHIVVYLGVDGGECCEYRQGGSYAGTGAPIDVELAFIDGEIHLLLDGKTHYLLNAANTPNVSLKPVFTANGNRSFGFITIGKDMVFSDYDFMTGRAAATASVAAMRRTVTMPASIEGGTLTASNSRPFLGETVTLSANLTDNYIFSSVKLGDTEIKDLFEDGVYRFTVTGDVTVAASTEQAELHNVTGTVSFGTLDPDFAGATVKAGSRTGTVQGDGTFTVRLPHGVYNLTVSSPRYASVVQRITVGETDMAVGTLTFTRYRFEEDGGYAYNADGSVALNGGNFSAVHFAGVNARDGFTLSFDLKRADNVTDVQGSWETGGFVIRKNGLDYKFWIISLQDNHSFGLYVYPPDNNWNNKIEIKLDGTHYDGTGAPLNLQVKYDGTSVALTMNNDTVYTIDVEKLDGNARTVYAPLFESLAADDTVGFGLLKVECPVDVLFENISYTVSKENL